MTTTTHYTKKTKAPKRKKEQRLAKRVDDQFKSGRKGRQLACLVRPLVRVKGMLKNPVINGDLDSQFGWITYVWLHPKMEAAKAWLDAQPSGSATGFKWKRSSLFFVVVVATALGMDVSEAWSRIRSDVRLRELGGFPPRLPADEAKNVDTTFPTRQSADDFVNRWIAGDKNSDPEMPEPSIYDEELSTRGSQVLALLETVAQEVAFEAILMYDLDTSRLATDGSIVLSGHRRPNPFRDDGGADFFTKSDEDGTEFGRMHHGVILVGAPFLLVSRMRKHKDGGEPGALKEAVLPATVEASRRLVDFAAAHGIEHKGFAGALMAGDGALHNHPCIEATANAGFLSAYNVGGDDLSKMWERKLPWTQFDQGGNEVRSGESLVDLRADGALLCRCRTSMAQAEREPMERRIKERHRSAYVDCLYCNRTYTTSPRSKDLTPTTGREPGEIDLRFDVTVPRWDRRFTAICFKARNEMEAVNGEMRTMGLLPSERGGNSWRGLTGDFRHEFWYGVGQLIFNIRVAYNLSQMTELEEYGWAEGFSGYLRNRKKIERQELLAEQRRNREIDRARRAKAPKHHGTKRQFALRRHPLHRTVAASLATALHDRAATHAST